LAILKESGFPIHEVKKGSYRLSRDLVKNLEVFDDTELALVVALKNLVGQLGAPFAKAAASVLDRLYDGISSTAVFVKIDDPMPLDSALLNKIVRAVREKRQVCFYYTGARSAHPVQMEPYRLAYFDGFWYLIGNEPATGIIKRYALDRIKDFKITKTGFGAVPKGIDEMLQQSANIWFAERQDIKVTVMIDAEVAHYFQRRRMFPTQEIIETRPDGSLIVTFHVSQYEAIRHILRSWIPHISILEPADLRASLVKELTDWVKRQKSNTF
ncbi:MAG: WYL domain-containing protein, partial [Syntrophales bacterium]|nr:WYL domain-containing protein [Syntrophales bacterium]